MFLEIVSESTSLASTNFQTTTKQSKNETKIPLVFIFDASLFRASQRDDDPRVLPLQPGAARHRPEAEEGRARAEQGEGGAGRAHRVPGEVELGIEWRSVYRTLELLDILDNVLFTGRSAFPFSGIIVVMSFLFCLTAF